MIAIRNAARSHRALLAVLPMAGLIVLSLSRLDAQDDPDRFAPAGLISVYDR